MDGSTIDSIPHSEEAPNPYDDYENQIYEVEEPHYGYDEQSIPIPDPEIVQMDASTLDSIPTVEEVDSIDPLLHQETPPEVGFGYDYIPPLEVDSIVHPDVLPMDDTTSISIPSFEDVDSIPSQTSEEMEMPLDSTPDTIPTVEDVDIIVQPDVLPMDDTTSDSIPSFEDVDSIPTQSSEEMEMPLDSTPDTTPTVEDVDIIVQPDVLPMDDTTSISIPSFEEVESIPTQS